MKKSNAAFKPLVVLCADILSEKNNLPRLTYVFVVLHIGFGRDERQHRRPIGRGDRNPAVSVWYVVVSDQAKSKRVTFWRRRYGSRRSRRRAGPIDQRGE